MKKFLVVNIRCYEICLITVACGIVLHAFVPQSLVASVSPPTEDVNELVTWVLETGKRTLMRKNIASVIGVASEDITVIERGFRIVGDKSTHVVGVRPGNGPGGIDFFFFARVVEEDGSATIWRSSVSGRLERAIALDPTDGVKLLSNEAQLGEFLSEKEYFRRKMHEVRPK